MFFSNPVKINLQLVHADQGAEKVFGCFVRQQATAESWWVGEHSHCTVHKNGQLVHYPLTHTPTIVSKKEKKKRGRNAQKINFCKSLLEEKNTQSHPVALFSQALSIMAKIWP